MSPTDAPPPFLPLTISAFQDGVSVLGRVSVLERITMASFGGGDFGSVGEPSRGSRWGVERGQRVWRGKQVVPHSGALFISILRLLLAVLMTFLPVSPPVTTLTQP